jgi:hypothetical protein
LGRNPALNLRQPIDFQKEYGLCSFAAISSGCDFQIPEFRSKGVWNTLKDSLLFNQYC